jgi:hypothetical protein
MMEAVSNGSVELHGTIFQKAVIFILAAVRT